MKKSNTRPVTFLWFCYISAIVTIVLFLTVAQAIIQLSITQEINVREAATMLHRQELKTQKMTRNALLVFGTPAQRTEALKELQSDVPMWEAQHASLETRVFVHLPVNVHGPLK